MSPSNVNGRPSTGQSATVSQPRNTCSDRGRRRLLGEAADLDQSSDAEEVPMVRLPPVVGPRRRGVKLDALVHHGRHFGCTVQMFASFNNLIREGILQEERMQAHDINLGDLSDEERQEHEIFIKLIRLCPFLMDRLFSSNRTNEDILYPAESLNRGASSARADDVKSMKVAVIDWITPDGGVLTPPLSRVVKTGRGFYHEATGAYLCPTDYDWSDPVVKGSLRSGQLVMSGLQWPKFLYLSNKIDPTNAWDGLFRSKILVLAYKHIFISPSAASGESRATRAGNTQIHGMKSVTPPSLAYVATLLRFSLGHWPIFTRNDKHADSERFYNGILDFLEEPDERTEVESLLTWWNSQIFPAQFECGEHSLPKTCALANLKRQRRANAQAALQSSSCHNANTGGPRT